LPLRISSSFFPYSRINRSPVLSRRYLSAGKLFPRLGEPSDKIEARFYPTLSKPFLPVTLSGERVRPKPLRSPPFSDELSLPSSSRREPPAPHSRPGLAAFATMFQSPPAACRHDTGSQGRNTGSNDRKSPFRVFGIPSSSRWRRRRFRSRLATIRRRGSRAARDAGLAPSGIAVLRASPRSLLRTSDNTSYVHGQVSVHAPGRPGDRGHGFCW
jgi:hypothetical protein